MTLKPILNLKSSLFIGRYTIGRYTNRKRIVSVFSSLVILSLASAVFMRLTASAAEPPWSPAHNSYAKRQKLTLTNSSSDSLASTTTVAVTVDTQSLGIRSDCNDLRVIYHPNSTTTTELSRSVSSPDGSTCSTSRATKVSFSLQATLASAASTSDYFLYFRNATASAPSSPDNAYDIGAKDALLVCPFDGTTTCAASETPSTATGAIRYSGGKSALSFRHAIFSSNYVEQGTNLVTQMSGLQRATYEAWVYRQDTQNAAGLIFVGNLHGDATTDRQITVHKDNTDHIAAIISTNDTDSTTAGTTVATISAGAWVHLAIVFYGTGSDNPGL